MALTKTSAIHSFGLQGRRLRLVVAVACPLPHWVCYASLQSYLLSSTFVRHQPGLGCNCNLIFFFPPGLQALVIKAQDPRKTPPVGSSPSPHLHLDLSIRWSSSSGLLSCLFVFSGQIRNPRPQMTGLLLPSQKTK